jgi:RimK family alpha-L-glutamate ligase
MRRLLAVYGLKTRDYGFLAYFYPTARLIETCENRSIPLRFLFPENVPEFLSGSHSAPGADSVSQVVPIASAASAESAALPRVPSARDFPPEGTVCLIRGRVGVEVIRLLESRGYRCVNPSGATALANDKLETARFLGRLGFPTPRTARLADLGSAFTTADYPLVVKPRHGSRGVGVTLAQTEREALVRAREILPDKDEWIAQEYVASSRGRDLRVFFASGELLACVKRVAPDGELVSNAAQGGVMRVPAFRLALGEPWSGMVRAIAEHSRLWYGTVDFLYRCEAECPTAAGKDHSLDLTICEINAAPGFEALETATGIDIAGGLIDRLRAEYP